MGFITPTVPDVDVDEFRRRSRREQIEFVTRDWAENGFGTPKGVLLVYVLKIIGYAVGGAAIIAASTPGLGSLSEIGTWWTEPIVLQKAVLWTLLFEVMGLGCGFGPLTFHFMPPLTAPLQWLRPGTTRLAPWPDKVPLTSGHTRTVGDVLLYLTVLAAGWWALLQPGSLDRAVSGLEVGLLDPVVVVPLLVLLPLLGLRDKAIFLAARSEQFLVMTALLLFPYEQMLTGSKWVLVAIWWGAATSKLNHHFPFVVSTMMTNAPGRPKWFKRALFRDFPRDLRPSRVSFWVAHLGTAMEFGVPLAMILGGGGIVTQVGVVLMVVFHIHIISALPLGVPLEWNVFFIYGTIYLFGVHGDVTMVPQSPLLLAFLLVALLAMPIYGSIRPDRVSFLASMRYYAGNWATSTWLLTDEAERRLHEGITAISPPIRRQLEFFYDDDTIDLLSPKIFAFRSLHSHGRALNGLVQRAVEDPEAYNRHEGELIAGIVLGWNFGEGHLHDESLLEALQAQCDFAPGEVRVVMLESQPIHRSTQAYRIVDAALGVLESGTVDVADMVVRQPWVADDELPFPVRVDTTAPDTRDAGPAAGPAG